MCRMPSRGSDAVPVSAEEFFTTPPLPPSVPFVPHVISCCGWHLSRLRGCVSAAVITRESTANALPWTVHESRAETDKLSSL